MSRFFIWWKRGTLFLAFDFVFMIGMNIDGPERKMVGAVAMIIFMIGAIIWFFATEWHRARLEHERREFWANHKKDRHDGR